MVSETNKPMFSPSYRLDDTPWKMTYLPSLIVAELKSILGETGFCSLGNKDELVLRFYLLVNNRRNLISYCAKMEIMESMKISEDLIYEQLQDEFLQEKDQLRK